MRCIRKFLPALFAILLAGGSAQSFAADEKDGWNLLTHSDDLTIYKRAHEDSSLQECKAVGLIDCAPVVVKKVLDDAEEYPKFMPYVTEVRVISRKENSRITYQRISAPLTGDRDYTLRVQFETKRAADGGISFYNHWKPANDLGPAEIAGVTRIKTNEGSWLLEPVGDGKQTRATYCIFCDPGGSIPAMFINTANKSAIPKIFDAIRKQAKLEKYSDKGK